MLITRCPNCETTFRVRMEQLNLRGGRVRCGHCHVPFSALSSLEELPEEAAAARIADSPRGASAPAQPAFSQPAASTHNPPVSPPPAPQPLAVEPPAPVVAPAVVAAAAPVPAMEFTPTPGPQDDLIAPINLPPTPPSLHRAERELQVPPAADDASSVITQVVPLDDAGAELDFDIEGLEPSRGVSAPPATAAVATVSEEENREEEQEDGEAEKHTIELGHAADDDAEAFDREFEKNLGDDEEDDALIAPPGEGEEDPDGETVPQLHTVFLDEEDIPPGANVDPAIVAAHKKARRTLILGNLLLFITGTLLGAYVLRVELTRYYPGLRPVLEQACAAFSCDVPYPRDADEVLLVGSDLTQAGSGYHLAVTVRNHARYPVAWPQLEITLTDRFERALTRRVLEPNEWLPASLAAKPAFDAQAELTSQITLSSDSQVVGYRLGVFYR